MQALVPHDDVAETKGQVDIFILDSDKVDDRSVECFEKVSHHGTIHLASVCDWYWVGVDHAVASLEDRVATRGCLFLSLVPDQVLLKVVVHDKAWSKIEMIALSIFEIINT